MDDIKLLRKEDLESVQELQRILDSLKNECLDLQKRIEQNKNLMDQLEKSQKNIIAQNDEVVRKLGIVQRREQEKYAIGTWNLEGATDKLMNLLERWMFFDKTITDKARLIYLCCLLERGQEEQAAVGLKRYFEERGANLICEFLPLAWLAIKIKIGGEVMKKAAYIFEKLEDERHNKYFERALKSHSFAVVGNSPDIIGSKSGAIINSRDIVFRMNTYKLNEAYIEDTGTKVNALADNSNFAGIDHENHLKASGLEWLYMPYDFWHIQLSQFTYPGKFLESYYQLFKNDKVKITWLFPDVSIELKQRLKMTSPSTGMALFYSIYKCFGYVKEDWFFGFSKNKRENGRFSNPLKDCGDEEHEEVQKANEDNYSSNDELSNFYKDVPCYSKGHNFNRELELRNELYMEAREKRI